MYKRFYDLKQNPFENTPDPAFLCATKKHNEALAALYYGVKRRKGFVMLTGEVGTGKTLVVRCLLKILDRASVAYAYVFNPRLTPIEFLQYIAGDLHLPTAGKSKSELLLDLSTYLIERHHKRLITVLVVDEAHHLSADVLEEIRLLTNLETGDGKLLQIVLVGQQELDEKIDRVDLRQLKQRIALRAKLSSLDLEESQAYIYRRLQLVGCSNPAEIFPIETITEIYQQSRGLPRLLNTICENALIHGYAAQTRTLFPAVIETIAADFRLNVEHPREAEDTVSRETSEVTKAAQTLIDLYMRLRGMHDDGAELPTRVPIGVRSHIR